MSADPEILTKESFEPHLGTVFRMTADGLEVAAQ